MTPELLLGWTQGFGGKLIPLTYGQKRPLLSGWQSRPLDQRQLFELLEKHKRLNYGLLLGKDAGNVVDFDLDSMEARKLGTRYLPRSLASFGRGSHTRSHLLFIVPEPKARMTWIDPVDNSVLLELRGDGHQTMLPPSMHPEGDEVLWSSKEQPSESDWDTLTTAGGRLAVASFLAKHWQSLVQARVTHFAVMAFSGALLRSGVDVDEVAGFIRSACEVNFDTGTDMQVRAVYDTRKNLDQGKEVTGWPTLAEHFYEESCAKIREWLGLNDPGRPFEKTDKYNASLLVQHFGDRIRFNPDRQSWFVWNGSYWEEDKRGFVLNYAAEIGNIIRRDAMLIDDAEKRSARVKWGDAARNLGRMTAMLKIGQAESELVALSSEFDRNPMLFNVKNGILDLDTGILDLPKKEELITKCAGTHYDPRATAPTFHAFLNKVLPDAEVRRYVQKALGYSLTGLTTEEVFFILYGMIGQNGKSTLMGVVSQVLGDYAMHASKESFIKQRNQQIRQDLAHMDGARLITTSEPETGDHLDSSIIKDLTGGDLIRARFLYGREFQFKPQGKLFMNTNHLPAVNALDPALWRRIRVIPFEVRISDEERDNSLKDRLRDYELPGVLNWLLEGVMLWQREGLEPPAAVAKAGADYRRNNDSTTEFVEDACVVDPKGTATISRQSLYAAYSDWCRTMGYRRAEIADFHRALVERGIAPVQKYGAKHWLGISLRQDDALSALPMPSRN